MPSSKPEMQSAYQRWEIGSLTKDSLGSASKMSQEMLIAHDKGYQAGLEEGRATGLAEGLAKGTAQGYADALEEGRERNEQMSEQFTALMTQFEAELQSAKEHTAQQMLNLCLDMTQAMLKSALDVRPELVIPIIEHALQRLPDAQAPAHIYVNATDLDVVQHVMGDDLKQEGWRLATDPSIEAGGCRLETATNQLDASLPARWQQLLSALGKSGDWLSL